MKQKSGFKLGQSSSDNSGPQQYSSPCPKQADSPDFLRPRFRHGQSVTDSNLDMDKFKVSRVRQTLLGGGSNKGPLDVNY